MNATRIILVVLLITGGIAGFWLWFQQSSTSVNDGNVYIDKIQSVGIRYMALGDSYTIGESVAAKDRWPNQLVARLQTGGTNINIVSNPSVTGFTTRDLIDRELPIFEKTKPNFVTILIGVNDYVQRVNSITFKNNLQYILDTVQKQLPKPGAIVLVTIPDYGKTPAGARFGNPTDSEAGIKAFNQVIIDEAKARNLPVADIFTVSQ